MIVVVVALVATTILIIANETPPDVLAIAVGASLGFLFGVTSNGSGLKGPPQ